MHPQMCGGGGVLWAVSWVFTEWIFPKWGTSVMCKVISAGFKGLPALLLLPHFLPLLLALFPGKGLWHPALVTILSGPHLMQGREGPLVIFNWVWNSPMPLSRGHPDMWGQVKDGKYAARGGTALPLPKVPTAPLVRNWLSSES